MRFSIIIVNYNSGQHLARCLESLRQQSYNSFEVILVDNRSSDDSVQLVRSAYSWVKLIESTENNGYGKGNNLGAQASQGDILVFLNPDTEAHRDWLSNLDATFAQYPDADLITSKILLFSDGDTINSAGNIVHYSGVSCCRGMGQSKDEYAEPDWNVTVSGAAFAVKRSVFEAIDGFDQNLFLYHDDVDFSLRSRIAGYRCLYAPQCVVRHEFQLTLPPMKWYWIEQNRLAVLLKLYRWRTIVLLLPVLVLVELMTWMYMVVQGKVYVCAKARSYLWVVRNWREILRSRKSVQRKRRVSDRELLQSLAVDLPFEQLLRAPASIVANSTVNTFFRIMHAGSVSLTKW